eukprot:m.32177 g.32177  ORF g.32177 m.32177 type:complete len:923 (+) comp14918_c0_seq2:977-3745(+)
MGSHLSGTFTGFLASMYLTHLIQTRQVPKGCSSYQMFRTALSHIATENWAEKPTKDKPKAGGIMMAPVAFDELPAEDRRPSLETFHSHFDVVFVDPSGFCNLLGDMTRSEYEHLRHQAALSLESLQNASIDTLAFDSVFLRKQPFVSSYDCLINVRVDPAVARRYPLRVLDRGGDWLAIAYSLLTKLLTRGLNTRAKLVVAQPRAIDTWPLSAEPPVANDAVQVCIGVLLDTTEAFRTLDLGPDADDPAAARFRDFWGQKCELRRFQGGQINEAVVWLSAHQNKSRDSDDAPQITPPITRTILRKIVQFVLLRHVKISVKYVTVVVNPLDHLLSPARGHLDTGPLSTHKAISRLDQLTRKLRDLEDLPLAFNTIQGISPSFQNTDPFPPKGDISSAVQETPVSSTDWRPAEIFIPVLEVLATFETSGKWPDDIRAIQKVKAAFYVNIAAKLRQQFGVVSTPTERFLDILFGGFVYRLIIFVERECHILETRATNLQISIDALTNTNAKGIEPLLEQKAALQNTVATLRGSFIATPKLALWVRGVAATHPAFAPSVRLCKRWLNAHMFADVLSDEAVEILVASVFLSPHPFAAPGLPHLGLLRFLHLLAHFDWDGEPLLVNFDGSVGVSELNELAEHFKKNRSMLPAMYLATPNELKSSFWTRDTPSKPLLARLVAFARECSKLFVQELERQCLPANAQLEEADLEVLFRTPLDEYDALLHLDHTNVPRYAENIDFSPDKTGEEQQQANATKRKYKNFELATLSARKRAKAAKGKAQKGKGSDESQNVTKPTTIVPAVDFDPVNLFVEDLRARFGDVALFFYDRLGGDVIGVAFDPQARAPHPFKANLCQHTTPVAVPPTTLAKETPSEKTKKKNKKAKETKDPKTEASTVGKKITLDIAGVVSSMQQLGRGLISRVQLREGL